MLEQSVPLDHVTLSLVDRTKEHWEVHQVLDDGREVVGACQNFLC